MDNRIFIELGLGLLVSGFCVIIQGVILLSLFSSLRTYFDRIEDHFHTTVNFAIVQGVVWILGIMHFIQVSVWAVTFNFIGCFDSFHKALYFSLVTYSTVGYGDMVAPDAWKLFGGVEAIMGPLMFGWSASFLFSTVNQFYKIRLRRNLNRK